MAYPQRPVSGLDKLLAHALVGATLAALLEKPAGPLTAMLLAAFGVAVHEAVDAPLAGVIASVTGQM